MIALVFSYDVREPAEFERVYGPNGDWSQFFAGARGYMRVMPFWTRVIGDSDASKLFHMQTNLRFGCVILRHYLDRENGDLFMALGRYNGSRGRPQYPNAVFSAAKAWEWRETAPAQLSPVPGVPASKAPGAP